MRLNKLCVSSYTVALCYNYHTHAINLYCYVKVIVISYYKLVITIL